MAAVAEEPEEETSATDPSVVADEEEETSEPTEESTQATEETTEPTEETTEATEESTEDTENPSESTDETQQTTEAPTETEPEWPGSEVAVTMDETYLTCQARVYEQRIELLLARTEEPVDQTTQIAIHVEWMGLEGTFYIDLQPYEVMTAEDEEEEEVQLQKMEVLASGVMDPERAITCIKLDSAAASEYVLSFFKGSDQLIRVRWSLDGESYAMLYDSSQLRISSEAWDGTVFLDFSMALEQGQIPAITVSAEGYEMVTVDPVLQALPQIPQLVIKTAELPYTVELSAKWGDAELALLPIERLSTDENGSLIYIEDAALSAEITKSGILIKSSQENVNPASGSYRMTVQWMWNDTAIEEQIIYFFINTN